MLAPVFTLLFSFSFQWEDSGDASQSGFEGINGRRTTYNKGSASKTAPAKHILHGFGGSKSQSHGKKGIKNYLPNKNMSDHHQNPSQSLSSNLAMLEPWYWFPSPAASWNGLDIASRAGSPKDELPWKIRASVIHSVRAHHGALRSFAVCSDESTVFTAGVGPGFKGNIQKWELSRVDCTSSYNGHEEVCFCFCHGCFSHFSHQII